MKKITLLFILLAAMAALQSCAPKEAPAEWEMTWNDEFDTDGAPKPAFHHPKTTVHSFMVD